MLDKAIIHGKEKRKPYRKSKRFDRSCRNHGSCDYCKDNRLHQKKQTEMDSLMKIAEYIEECLEEEDDECNERGLQRDMG